MNNNVRKVRESKTLTRHRLAERAGVNINTIINAEMGYHTPTLTTLAKLAEALDCQLTDLLIDQDAA